MWVYSLKSDKTNTHLPTILPEKYTITVTWKPGCEPLSNTARSHHTRTSPGYQYPGVCTNHFLDFTILAIMYYKKYMIYLIHA